MNEAKMLLQIFDKIHKNFLLFSINHAYSMANYKDLKMLLYVIALTLFFAATFRGLKNGYYILHILCCAGFAYLMSPDISLPKNFSEQLAFKAVVIHLCFINIFTFITYMRDKAAAKNGTWRVPEKTLHAFMFVGGTPSAYLAQKTLRHKTKKSSFKIKFWILLVVQVGVLVYLRFYL